jgi:hypothetical protein
MAFGAQPYPFPAMSMMARMLARTASGKVGQASINRCNSGEKCAVWRDASAEIAEIPVFSGVIRVLLGELFRRFQEPDRRGLTNPRVARRIQQRLANAPSHHLGAARRLIELPLAPKHLVACQRDAAENLWKL